MMQCNYMLACVISNKQKYFVH